MKLLHLFFALFIAGSSIPFAAAGIVFSQDFSTEDDLNAYLNASADASNTTQFTELSATENGGTWSIVDGALVLDRTEASTFTRTNVLRREDLDGGTLFSVQFSLSINKEGNYSYNGTGFLIGRNNIPYGGHDAERLNSFAIDPAPGSSYKIIGNDLVTFSLNQAYIYRIYSNFSGESETYVGPDNATHTLDGDNFSLWIGNTLVFDNRENPYAMTSGNDIHSFAVEFGKPDGAVWVFDDFVVRNDLALVPEPSTSMLWSLGLAGLAARRRRVC
jgi:hypothetical protein